MKKALLLCLCAASLMAAYSPPSRGDTPAQTYQPAPLTYAPQERTVFATPAVLSAEAVYLISDRMEIDAVDCAGCHEVCSSATAYPAGGEKKGQVKDVDHLCNQPFDHGIAIGIRC